MSLDEADTIRDQRIRQLRDMRSQITRLTLYIEEKHRDSLLAIHAEVEENANGDYQSGDLESVVAMAITIRQQLRALANSFTSAP